MRRFEVHDADEDLLAEGVQFSDQSAVIQDEYGKVTTLDGPAFHGLDGHLVWLDQASEASYLHAQLRAEKAEATIARSRAALATFEGRGVNNFDIPTPAEILEAWRASLDQHAQQQGGNYA